MNLGMTGEVALHWSLGTHCDSREMGAVAKNINAAMQTGILFWQFLVLNKMATEVTVLATFLLL